MILHKPLSVTETFPSRRVHPIHFHPGVVLPFLKKVTFVVGSGNGTLFSQADHSCFQRNWHR
jgi:hypothetical protein